MHFSFTIFIHKQAISINSALWRASNECVSVAANMLNKAEENFQRASDDLEESEAELAAELQQQASEQ